MRSATSSTRSVMITRSLCPRSSRACCASCTLIAPSSPQLALLGREHSNCTGSLPCLRPAHHIDSKGLRSGIDLRRIPHKMLETPASHKEEPDAWILSVSKPGLHYQHSG